MPVFRSPGKYYSESVRLWQQAPFPKVHVFRADGTEEPEDAFCAFKYSSPSSGSMLDEGTLKNVTDAAVASGLVWTDHEIKRVRQVREEDEDG